MLDYISLLLLGLVSLVSIFIAWFNKQESNPTPHETLRDIMPKKNLSELLEAKKLEKQHERTQQAKNILDDSGESFTSIIPVPADVELIEKMDRLLIKGSVKSLSLICDYFALMEQLPEEYCMLMGQWEFSVLEGAAASSLMTRTVTMPRDYWLFMSCKLRDSILGYDVHPYNYVYEPLTFKQVLEYGIAVEATDYIK
ncbi:hypothetical protein [Pedobacter alpinus]|uniref:Uncharacterized protein n=1 Tax=Pedobacter alpinus TaxID=1590643 RepID=A0ABW5TPN7_9SPHI